MTFNEIHAVVKDYCIVREQVVVAERAMFLSTVQNQGESNDDYLERLRETARYCKLSELKNTADAEDGMIRMKFIRRLRSPDSNLKLLEASRIKTGIGLTDMKTVLQFGNQTQFSLLGYLKLIVRKIAYNSNPTFKKPVNVNDASNGKEL